MKVVIVELPAKAKTINKYLGKDYGVYASFGHVRDLAAKDGSVDPDDDFAMRWEVDGKAAKRLSEIGAAVKTADRVILATDPDREGEAISWHIHEILIGQEAPQGQARRPGGVQRRHQGRGSGGHASSARDRRGAGRRLPGAPRARLSGRLHPLAGVVAQAPRRALGGAGPVGRPAHRLRPRARDREVRVARILVDRRPFENGSRRAVLRPPGRRGRQEDQPSGRRLGRRGRSLQGGAGNSEVLGRRDRVEARQAPPIPAVHHLHLAAGGLAQARPRAGAHDADRPAPLRRRRHRRRRGRPHHLYAHRRRRSRARGGLGRASGHRQGFRRRLRAGRAAQIHRQGQERPGGPRGDPPDRHDAPPARRGAPSRARTGQALRTDLDAHHRLPDGERRTRTHHRRHSG